MLLILLESFKQEFCSVKPKIYFFTEIGSQWKMKVHNQEKKNLNDLELHLIEN